MAATAEGKTSIRPHCRDWMSAVVVFEAIRWLMVQFGSARKRLFAGACLFDSSRKVTHGQAVRDLRQDAAVRTSRQPRQEPGQPEVSAQPPDGPRDGEGPDFSRARLHALPEDVLGLTRRPRPVAPGRPTIPGMAIRTSHPARVMGMVLAGGEGKRLMPLTLDRAKPAVPFGGTYRLIDFCLSNLVNAGVRKIAVLTQYKSHSLDRHIAQLWRLNRLRGNYLASVPAQMRRGPRWFAGSAAAIYQNVNLIND